MSASTTLAVLRVGTQKCYNHLSPWPAAHSHVARRVKWIAPRPVKGFNKQLSNQLEQIHQSVQLSLTRPAGQKPLHP